MSQVSPWWNAWLRSMRKRFPRFIAGFNERRLICARGPLEERADGGPGRGHCATGKS